MGIRILNADPQTYIKADPSMLPIIQAVACFLIDFRHGDVGISSGNFLQFYFDCHNGSPGKPHSECLYGSINLRDIGPYAPDQPEVCILTDFLVWEKGTLLATFFNFIQIAILALLGTSIPNAYMDPQTYMTADLMYPAKQKCVSLPTSGVGKGISSSIFLQLNLDCYIGSPGNPHSECSYESTNLHDNRSYAPGQAEVCILTDFRCGKGGLFRHPGETVRILQSVVVAGAHHVAVVIARRALTPAKHTVLFIVSLLSVLRIRILRPGRETGPLRE
jgi:hypothetical protein